MYNVHEYNVILCTNSVYYIDFSNKLCFSVVWIRVWAKTGFGALYLKRREIFKLLLNEYSK